MPKPLSQDLRHRIVAAVEAGGGMRAVAARYDVSPSSVSNISRLWRATGSIAAKLMGGDRRSHKTEAHGAQILALVSQAPDITLDAIQAALRNTGAAVGRISIWRLLERHDLSFKKNRARRRAGAPRRRRGANLLERDAAST